LSLEGLLVAEYRIPSSVWGDRRTIHIYKDAGSWVKYKVPLKVEGLKAHRNKLPEGVTSISEAEDLIRSVDLKEFNVASRVVGILSRLDLPRRRPTEDALRRDFELLVQAKGEILSTGQILATSNAGFLLCDTFYEHMREARYRGNPSLKEAWGDPRWLYRAVQFQLKVGDPLLPWNVLRALKAILRAPSNMRPAVAKLLVESYCPVEGLVLDPCAGFGGRFLGASAAGRKYLGVDPHPKAAESAKGLAVQIGVEGSPVTTGAFEDVDLGNIQADMAVTSPPYFAAEVYAEEANQSATRYPRWDLWREGFLRSLLRKTYTHLRPGAVFCLNVSNVKIRKVTFPIVSDSVQLAKEAGFEYDNTLYMPLKQLSKKRNPEPVLVFRKP
jgi:hypothetical protein